MLQKSLALLFDPEHPQTHRAAIQMASHLRSVVRCIVVPADRHLPVRLEDLEVDAVLNLITHPERARNVHAACRLMDIPTAGPEAFALTLVTDRMMLKDFLNIHNLPTPASYVPHRPVKELEFDHRNFGFPVRVMPRYTPAEVRIATDLDTLVRLVDDIRNKHDEAVVERPVTGKILYTSLWGQKVIGTAESLMYSDGAHHIEEVCIPATLPGSSVKTVERMAQRIAELLLTEGALLVTSAHDETTGDCILSVDAAPCLQRDSLFVRIATAYGFTQRDIAMSLTQRVFGRTSQNVVLTFLKNATSAS